MKNKLLKFLNSKIFDIIFCSLVIIYFSFFGAPLIQYFDINIESNLKAVQFGIMAGWFLVALFNLFSYCCDMIKSYLDKSSSKADL